MFHKGQHVACIAEINPYPDAHLGVRYPVKGAVYTVREVCDSLTRSGKTLLLEEIVNPEILYGHKGTLLGRLERRFHSDKFRPLAKLKVEDFTRTLTPVKADA